MAVAGSVENSAAIGRCSDCGADVSGRFCSGCGQATGSPIRPVVDFAREGVAEVFDLDGRQLTSLRLLATRPGLLPRDYVDGRRSRYVHPVRLFLQVGTASYLITRLLPADGAMFGIGPAIFGEATSVIGFIYAAALIPLLPLAHWLALRYRKPMFMEHAVFGISVLTFSFLLAPLQGLLYAASLGNSVLETLSALIAPLALGMYWYLALVRFYGITDRREKSKAVVRVYGSLIVFVLPLEVWYQLAQRP